MKLFMRLIISSLCCSATAHSADILVGFTNGDPVPTLIIEGRELVPTEISVSDDAQELWIAYSSETQDESLLFPKKTYAGYRNFAHKISEEEKNDILYILKTLAQKSLTSLWGAKTQLEHAGQRIDHVHPLRFLECVFSDEELKAYIHNIKKRGSWVWSEFIKGFKSSFDEEALIGNIRQEYLQEFANNLGVRKDIIETYVKNGKWEDLIKTLIAIIPREGDPGRYDQ